MKLVYNESGSFYAQFKAYFDLQMRSSSSYLQNTIIPFGKVFFPAHPYRMKWGKTIMSSSFTGRGTGPRLVPLFTLSISQGRDNSYGASMPGGACWCCQGASHSTTWELPRLAKKWSRVTGNEKTPVIALNGFALRSYIINFNLISFSLLFIILSMRPATAKPHKQPPPLDDIYQIYAERLRSPEQPAEDPNHY